MTWELTSDSPYLQKDLYVRQWQNNQVVEEGAVINGLTVTYGPEVSSAAPSKSYIGEVQSNQANDSIDFFNNGHYTDIEFGPDMKLVIDDGNWTDVYWYAIVNPMEE